SLDRFSGLRRRFGGLDRRFGDLDGRFGGLGRCLGGLSGRFGGLSGAFRLFAGFFVGAVFELLVASVQAGFFLAAAATAAAAAAALAFRIDHAFRAFGAFSGRNGIGSLLGGVVGLGGGFRDGRLGVGQGGGNRLGQRGDHAFLFAHRRVGLALLAAVAATAAAAVAAGAGVVTGGLFGLLGAVRCQGRLSDLGIALGARFVAVVALAAFLAFAFGATAAAHVVTAA
ncbi:hypothetical protein, partial [Achromobacter denitrificans]|uniref:hypothetical protein n=1 Tax=Achromobacter denitrificans TaxID=32002 RepID=UPI0035311AC4